VEREGKFSALRKTLAGLTGEFLNALSDELAECATLLKDALSI